MDTTPSDEREGTGIHPTKGKVIDQSPRRGKVPSIKKPGPWSKAHSGFLEPRKVRSRKEGRWSERALWANEHQTGKHLPGKEAGKESNCMGKKRKDTGGCNGTMKQHSRDRDQSSEGILIKPITGFLAADGEEGLVLGREYGY